MDFIYIKSQKLNAVTFLIYLIKRLIYVFYIKSQITLRVYILFTLFASP